MISTAYSSHTGQDQKWTVCFILEILGRSPTHWGIRNQIRSITLEFLSLLGFIMQNNGCFYTIITNIDFLHVVMFFVIIFVFYSFVSFYKCRCNTSISVSLLACVSVHLSVVVSGHSRTAQLQFRLRLLWLSWIQVCASCFTALYHFICTQRQIVSCSP